MRESMTIVNPQRHEYECWECVNGLLGVALFPSYIYM